MPSSHAAAASSEGLVSIVIPARNAARWIGEAIASAVAQVHRPIEIVVVDNGSIDDTRERAREAATADVPLTVIEEAVAGPSAARNAGLGAARGRFVQFLDADDALTADKISRQHALLVSTGADVVWGGFRRVHDDDRTPLLEQSGALVSPALGDDLEAGLLGADGFVHLGSLLIRRDAIGDLRFDADVRVVEDVRFVFALARSGARFVRQTDESGYVMREHEDAARASRVARAEFADSCAAMALAAEASWRAEGTLGEERRAVLAKVHANVARWLSRVDPARSRAALGRARQLTPRYYEGFSPRWQPFVRTIGFERTERLAHAVRSIRRAIGLRG